MQQGAQQSKSFEDGRRSALCFKRTLNMIYVDLMEISPPMLDTFLTTKDFEQLISHVQEEEMICVFLH